MLSRVVPHYLISEYPKSGGSWFAQMMAEALQIPFPRNASLGLGIFRTSILHGHHLYSPRFHNVTYVVRDGRDVVTSAYYHMLFHNERNPAAMVNEHRRRFPCKDYDDVTSNLPAFIEYLFTEHSQRRFHFSWSQFVRALPVSGVMIVKYEDLLEDTAAVLANALQQVAHTSIDDAKLQGIVERFSFKNQAKRDPGDEDQKSFLRKGVAGDWKNKFTSKACEVFKQFAGEELISMGYESDLNWSVR